MAGLVQAAPSWYPAWNGPINIPVVLPSGHLADTPEVASLKHAHAVAVANTPGGEVHPTWPGYAPLYAPWAAHYPSWHGPINVPVVLPSGHLADTPDVTALKAAHATAMAHSYH